jgi:hypothetical protein
MSELPPTKLSQIRDALARGDEVAALRVAARFPVLGAHRERIQRAWAAHANPTTYADMGYDVEKLVQDGVAALRERYDL